MDLQQRDIELAGEVGSLVFRQSDPVGRYYTARCAARHGLRALHGYDDDPVRCEGCGRFLTLGQAEVGGRDEGVPMYLCRGGCPGDGAPARRRGPYGAVQGRAPGRTY